MLLLLCGILVARFDPWDTPSLGPCPNFFLGLILYVTPPQTWRYSCMHFLYPSGSKFMRLSVLYHSMILRMWPLHILRFILWNQEFLICMQIKIPLKGQFNGFLTLPNGWKLCRNHIYLKSIDILHTNPNILGFSCCFLSKENFSFTESNIIASILEHCNWDQIFLQAWYINYIFNWKELCESL